MKSVCWIWLIFIGSVAALINLIENHDLDILTFKSLGYNAPSLHFLLRLLRQNFWALQQSSNFGSNAFIKLLGDLVVSFSIVKTTLQLWPWSLRFGQKSDRSLTPLNRLDYRETLYVKSIWWRIIWYDINWESAKFKRWHLVCKYVSEGVFKELVLDLSLIHIWRCRRHG